MQYKFPKDFLWGGAVSATQTEGWGNPHVTPHTLGDKGENIWDYWYRIDKEKFFNQVGPDVASDFLNHYHEDAKLMREIGFNSFRTSISWSRLIPDGDGAVSQEAVAYYNDMIDTMIAAGIDA